MTKYDYMVDVETYGVGPTAALIQIGACEFDKVTGQIGRKFKADIQLQSSIRYGGTIDDDTVEWWRGRELKQTSAHTLPSALEAFERWYQGSGTWSEAEVWCKGLAFDIPILDNAFKAVGLKSPWHYRKPRDIRTLKAVAATFGYVELKDNVEPTHDGLEDCVLQVPQVVEPYRFLDGLHGVRRTC